MIENDAQLAVVQRQLGIVEEIVESWKKKLLPHNPKNFAIYAEGAIEQADILRAEIDEYLARHKSLPPKTNTPQTTAGPQPTNVS
jgi:hypothetical protein